MWIITSKNADGKLKAFARGLADALPEYGFFARGDKPIGRVDRLAQRGGIEHYLMVGKSNVTPGGIAIWSRKYVVDGDVAFWAWNARRMEGVRLEGGKKPEPSEPYEFMWDEKGQAGEIAEFFGYEKGKREEIYEESEKIKITVKGGKKSIKASIGNEKEDAKIEFTFANIDGSEEE